MIQGVNVTGTTDTLFFFNDENYRLLKDQFDERLPAMDSSITENENFDICILFYFIINSYDGSFDPVSNNYVICGFRLQIIIFIFNFIITIYSRVQENDFCFLTFNKGDELR